MPAKLLSSDELHRTCAPDAFEFETTADLEPSTMIIGQPRGTRAIEFGIGIRSEGYNVYVLGPVGTGRATAIERFLQARTGDRPAPPDWIYVHNFRVPHQPRAIALPAGHGSRFQAHMSQLIADLRRDLPQAFETETYEQAIEAVQTEFGQTQDRLMQEMQHRAAAAGFGLLNTPSGLTLVPVQEGQPLPAEALQALPIEARVELEKQRQTLTDALHDTLRQVHQLETAARQQIRQIDRDVAAGATQHHFEQLQAQYAAEDEVLLYLGEVRQDVLDQIDDFAPPAERDGQPIDLRRYQVNLLVDHADSHSVPVVVEQHPTFHNLFGRIEYEMEAGVVTTRFTNIKSGSLHRANGGYLIMDAEDLLLDGITWDDLKRTLKSGVIRVQPSATMDGGRVLAKSLDPEPIPLDLKLILLGNAGIYYMLYEQDEDFSSLFKVRADFDSVMPRDAGHEQAYAAFVATRCHKEKLCHFDRAAVARVVEFGSRLAEHQRKLSTRFGAVADLVREASYWAGLNGRTATTVADVRQALVERMQRANRIEERMLEQILEGSIFIATEGAVVGQVNGLSVLDTGEYSFGQAGRITARTFMGESGVMHIERETDMSGPIHQKGVLTLTGYLGGMYAQQQPLSLSASLTFEQNYGGIEGDSASSAELYALLSSLGRIPLKQGIAVTGSVNQHGEVQPIGGVNEKIEGFFRLCQARGLTGEQGVVIPASNCEHLALDEDVLAATAAGQFHVWAISRIDEGIELLTGRPAGVRGADGRFTPNSVHDIVQQRLLMLARDLKSFGDEEEEEEEEEEG